MCRGQPALSPTKRRRRLNRLDRWPAQYGRESARPTRAPGWTRVSLNTGGPTWAMANATGSNTSVARSATKPADRRKRGLRLGRLRPRQHQARPQFDECRAWVQGNRGVWGRPGKAAPALFFACYYPASRFITRRPPAQSISPKPPARPVSIRAVLVSRLPDLESGVGVAGIGSAAGASQDRWFGVYCRRLKLRCDKFASRRLAAGKQSSERAGGRCNRIPTLHIVIEGATTAAQRPVRRDTGLLVAHNGSDSKQIGTACRLLARGVAGLT